MFALQVSFEEDPRVTAFEGDPPIENSTALPSDPSSAPATPALALLAPSGAAESPAAAADPLTAQRSTASASEAGTGDN